MAKPMRHHIRTFRRSGMSAADVWREMRTATEQDAKRLGWSKTLLSDTLQSHWNELAAVYPKAEIAALGAAEVKRHLASKSKLWHLKQRARMFFVGLGRGRK